ncbi:hypothetical protein SCOR_25115 [Sulfidibacter corallicola]|uniref:Uncharacterized protein n=1 Tax=Sulfidibacter corallicola TaxID=2818388 RepID=A0A8A4TT25_SULCO|nr:hypothetical protein [Sulfidibacter corallicola]QTD52314.1 hypothetical protein J3U87_07550 [Sulfidibacter corallicola]
MYNLNKISVLKFAFALTSIAFFAFPAMAGTLDEYPEVRDTLNNDNLVLNNYWGCLNEGYNLGDIAVDPMYYIVAPEGDHVAFNVTITLSKHVGGEYSLQTNYVHIKCTVMNDGNGNLSINRIEVVRSTVY